MYCAEKPDKHHQTYGENSIRILRQLRAWILLRSFNSRPNDVYRAVHHLSDNAFFFEEYAREFFEAVDVLLRRNCVTAVRRLLVYDSSDQLDQSDSAKIINFHMTSPGYDCRIMAVSEWQSILVNESLPPSLDLGIFGDKRAYRTRRDKPDYIIGTWTSKKSDLTKLIATFDASWHKGRRPHLSFHGQMSVAELFRHGS